MFCEKCGNELKENARFCEKCGTPVKIPEGQENVQNAAGAAPAGASAGAAAGASIPKVDAGRSWSRSAVFRKRRWGSSEEQL